MRRLPELLVRCAVHPATLGAGYLLTLVALAARRGDLADESLGGQSRAISAAVHTHFGGELSRMTVAIVGITLAVGTALGLLAAALLGLRRWLLEQNAASPWVEAAEALALVAFLHGLVESYAIAATPQLFAGVFYAQGGLSRTLEVVLTDVLGRSGVIAVGVACVALFFAGPAGEWKEWPRRLLRARRVVLASRATAPMTGAAVVLGLVSIVPGHGIAVADGPPAKKPNVLILAADSLRNDRVDPRVAPHLAALGESGVRFDSGYVSLPRTFPSWVTLLTGRHPHHHGIRSMFPRWEDRAKDFDALPARFAREGYFTTVVSDFAGDIFDRIDLGWSETHVPTFDFRQLIRQRAIERQTPLLPYLQSSLGRSILPVLRELSDAADPRLLTHDAIHELRRAADKPFFMTVFYSTAHFPYAAPAPYYGLFTRPEYRGRYKYDRPVGLEHDAPPDAADVAQVRALYDGAVAGIDAGVSEILGELAASGQAKNTIVVVIADHGETLYENGHGEGHGDHLFGDEGTHVPFIVKDPRRPEGARHVPGIVRDVDLAPTLYELAGVTPPADLDGASLVPAMHGEALSPRLAYAETGLWFTEDVSGVDRSLRLPYPGVAGMTEVDADHGDEVVLSREHRPLAIVAKHRMVRDERWKLIYMPTRAGVRYVLYDTKTDPGETVDVSAQHPQELSRLKGELWRWLLADSDMVERGGFLVPRDGGGISPPKEAEAHVIRVDAPEAEP